MKTRWYESYRQMKVNLTISQNLALKVTIKLNM